ncbi:MAG TPA: helicase-exonuclease AddAB subunit AddA [Desulfitobacteriaceae bacterium]|nr:helicase-exonuclease AddAB subunit AddA [Desulfitobacteriaceae bacterium]
MSKVTWTNEQIAAIKWRGQLLVAAAAGSGKTAVLVERVMRRITDPIEMVDVDNLLVVTFTKAAANEMKARISTALTDALFENKTSAEIALLLKQQSLLQQANITTLHSYCLDLLRQYFYKLDLDPAFRVVDEEEAELLRQDVIEEVFIRSYEKNDASFLRLIEAFGSDRDDHPLMIQVMRIFKFASSQVSPESWLQNLPQAYTWQNTEALAQSSWGVTVHQAIGDQLKVVMTLQERALEIALSSNGPAQYVETIQKDLKQTKALQQILGSSWAESEKSFQAISFSDLPRSYSKKSLSTDDQQIFLREQAKKMRDEAKARLNRIKEEVFIWPLEQQILSLAEMAELVQTMADLIIEFSKEYSQAKKRRNIVDFSDLEHMVICLLENDGEASEIAQSLRKRFAEVLVDEYQDINPVQERIIMLLAPQKQEISQLFMVGDIKQSIYRFRMADPGLFTAKYNAFPHWAKGLTGSAEPTSAAGLVINLVRNFRSRKEIVEGVNFIFRQIMTVGAGEIEYNDLAALQYGAAYPKLADLATAEGPIEVHLFASKEIKETLRTDSQNPSETETSPEEMETVRIEARLVAARIFRMVNTAEFVVYDKKIADFRPVQYSDIVILMRSYATRAPVYLEELQSAAIPVYAETNNGYFGTSEMEIMLSLLKIIDNPRLDIPLAAILRSPLAGLNGTELARIRTLLPKAEFYEAWALAVWAAATILGEEAVILAEVQQVLSSHRDSWNKLLLQAQKKLAPFDSLSRNIVTFWKQLQHWRTFSRHNSLAELIWLIYEETGFLAYVGSLPAGIQRQANLKTLYDRAVRFEAANYRGLFRFLCFIDKFHGLGKDLGNARVLGESENVVRMLTVHASKGLEFPVVFAVGLGSAFNTRDLAADFLLHTRLGLGLPIIDWENSVRYPSFLQYAVKQLLAQENLAEELRILYVCLTRAREKLLLYGNVCKLDDTLIKWQRSLTESTVALPDGQLRTARCFLDWIGPALARHPAALFGQSMEPNENALPESRSLWQVYIHRDLLTESKQVSDLGRSETEKEIGEEAKQEGEIPAGTDNQAESAPIKNECHEKEIQTEPAEPDWYREVNARLSWQYAYPLDVRQRAKLSVSEIKKHFGWSVNGDERNELILPDYPQQDYRFIKPKFLQTAAHLSPAEYGTAMHTLMQHLPFAVWGSVWENTSTAEQVLMVKKLLTELVGKEILSISQAESIPTDQIISFLNSELGQKLLRSPEQNLLREAPFTYNLRQLDSKTDLLIQGVIDALIIKGSTADLIDYKTDFLVPDLTDPEQILRERYAMQMALYVQAVEDLLKLNVDNCLIYSFALNRKIVFPRSILQEQLVKLRSNLRENIAFT